MNWPNDIHNRRARVGTALFMTLLLLFIFFFGLTYLNPPPNSGPVINFGFDEQGAGETASSEQVDEPVQEQQQEVTPPPTESTPVVTDEVTTQDVEDAAVIDKKEDPKPPVEQSEKVKDPPKEKPKPTSKLSNALKRTSEEGDASKNYDNNSGEGDTKGGGDKGKKEGDPRVKSYDGNGGPGEGYFMEGRSAIDMPKPINDCLDANGKRFTGRVVIKVIVNSEGKVTRAEADIEDPSGKKSNYTSECLERKAIIAAKKTTWTASPEGRDFQVGYITYNITTN